ncbi:glycine zipper 2TM domain-containing protein [Cupriavidus plantarum]|uniref:glycine zipper 2TM domain-containing protein n=1 Tax=Cupriavidus plantarum TaxID=942865 RepID=UPI0035C6B218
MPQSPVPSTPSATTPSATTPSSSTPVPRSRRLHPLVGAAAVAVVVASLTAVAAMTGVLPTSKANQNANMEAAPTATPSATAPVAGYVPQTPPPGSTTRPPAYEQASNNAPPPPAQPAAQQPAPAVKPSHTAGRIVAVTPIQTEKPTSGLGAVGGAVVGGLLGNQIGRGNGRILGTVAGAAAGGYAGNVVEKHVNKDTQYRVSVKMDDGTQRTFTYERDPGVQIGQRVHMERGVLVNG